MNQNYELYNNNGPIQHSMVPMGYEIKPLKTDVQIGSIKIRDMISLSTYGPGIVIIITYLISTYNGDTIPWPVMITDTASYYPQNILFRIGLLVPLFYWCVTILLVKWWLRSGELSAYGLGGAPLNLEIIGYASVLCYGITISTIDQGQTATHIHGACAVIFLALQMIFEVSLTIVLVNIRKVNPSFVSQWSLDRKIFLCYIWIIPIIALIYEAIYDNKYGIALAEWVAVYTVIFYVQSFGEDLKHYELTIDDEGFKLADLQKKIGYAPEYCVETEQENDLRPFRDVTQQLFHNIVHPHHQTQHLNQHQQAPVVIPTGTQPYQLNQNNIYQNANPLPQVEMANIPSTQSVNNPDQVYYYNPSNGQLFTVAPTILQN